jgi:hypothetical protein
MATVNIEERIITIGHYEYRYAAEDFANLDSIDYSMFSDKRMNRAYVIHNAGTVLAIVFSEYYAYCEQDALDEAVDRGKLNSLLISDSELPDYQTGTDSEGYPEYDGIAYLGNASEPFDQSTLDLFTVPASLFRGDEAVKRAIREQYTVRTITHRLYDVA